MSMKIASKLQSALPKLTQSIRPVRVGAEGARTDRTRPQQRTGAQDGFEVAPRSQLIKAVKAALARAAAAGAAGTKPGLPGSSDSFETQKPSRPTKGSNARQNGRESAGFSF